MKYKSKTFEKFKEFKYEIEKNKQKDLLRFFNQIEENTLVKNFEIISNKTA